MLSATDNHKLFIEIKNFSVIWGCSLNPADVKTILKNLAINPKELGFNTLSDMLKEIPELELRTPKAEGEEPQVVVKFLAEMHPMYETPLGQAFTPRPEARQRKHNWVMPERSLPVRIEGDKVVVEKAASEPAPATEPQDEPTADSVLIERDEDGEVVNEGAVLNALYYQKEALDEMEAEMLQENQAEAALFNAEEDSSDIEVHSSGALENQDQPATEENEVDTENVSGFTQEESSAEKNEAPAARPRPRF